MVRVLINWWAYIRGAYIRRFTYIYIYILIDCLTLVCCKLFPVVVAETTKVIHQNFNFISE